MTKEEGISKIKGIYKKNSIIMWYGYAFWIAIVTAFLILYVVLDFDWIFLVLAIVFLIFLPGTFFKIYWKLSQKQIKAEDFKQYKLGLTKEDVFNLVIYARKIVLWPYRTPKEYRKKN